MAPEGVQRNLNLPLDISLIIFFLTQDIKRTLFLSVV